MKKRLRRIRGGVGMGLTWAPGMGAGCHADWHVLIDRQGHDAIPDVEARTAEPGGRRS